MIESYLSGECLRTVLCIFHILLLSLMRALSESGNVSGYLTTINNSPVSIPTGIMILHLYHHRARNISISLGTKYLTLSPQKFIVVYMRKMSLFLFGFILLIPIVKVSAHQSGCHRWHSCPSDTGSYVCGDLGYTSGCPKAVNVQKPVPVKATQIVTVVPQITKEEKCLNKSVEFGDTFLIQKGYHKNQDGSWTDKKGKYPKTRLENKMEKKQTAIYTACLALN